MVDPKYPASRIIECVTVAAARAWLQITEASSIPDQVQSFLDSFGLACQSEVLAILYSITIVHATHWLTDV